LAVNLDDHKLPPNSFRRATGLEAPFTNTNLQFIERHQQRFLKYLRQYRITAILVSAIGIVLGADGVAHVRHGITIRALQSLPDEHIALLEQIRKKLAA
jgi:hypothetical protein